MAEFVFRVTQISDLENNISEIKNPSVGFIRLGIIPVSRLAMVPDTLKEFGKIYPGIALVAANNRVELTMESTGITYKILTSGSSIVIVSQDNPLALQDKISLSHLRNERIILNRQGFLGEEIRPLLGDSIKSNIFSQPIHKSLPSNW